MTDSIENDNGPHHEQKFTGKQLPLQAVTVFTDRAEIKRTFPVKLAAGYTDITIEVIDLRKLRKSPYSMVSL